MSGIKPIIDLALSYNEMLCIRDSSTPYMWISAGCDMEKDILPTMKEIIKRRPKDKPKISSYSYFTNAVYAARDKRELEAEIKTKQIRPVDPKWMAKAYAWKRRMGLQYDESFLNNYESQHGRIEA